MIRIGICLGGQECGKSIIADSNEVETTTTTYKCVSLKIIKSIHGNFSERRFLLNQPLDIYVPTEYYENYEVALKLILNSFIDAEWEEV